MMPLSTNNSMMVTSKTLQNQDTFEKVMESTPCTENEDSYEYEEMSKIKEVTVYKQYLAKGIYMIRPAEILEAFSDEEVGNGLDQVEEPRVFTDGKGLQSKQVGKESDEEIVSEKKTEVMEVADVKKIRESEENSKSDSLFDDLPDKTMNSESEDNKDIAEERRSSEQNMTFDSETELVEEPDSYMECERHSEQDSAEELEQPKLVEYSSEEKDEKDEKDDDEVETENLWYDRNCTEQETENVFRATRFFPKFDLKHDHLSGIPEEQEGPEDSEGNVVVEQVVQAQKENLEFEGDRKEAKAEAPSDVITEKEVSESERESGGEREDGSEGDGDQICEKVSLETEHLQRAQGKQERKKGKDKRARCILDMKEREEDKGWEKGSEGGDKMKRDEGNQEKRKKEMEERDAGDERSEEEEGEEEEPEEGEKEEGGEEEEGTSEDQSREDEGDRQEKEGRREGKGRQEDGREGWKEGEEQEQEEEIEEGEEEEREGEELEKKKGDITEEEEEEEEGQEGDEREREEHGSCEDDVEEDKTYDREEGEYKKAIGKVADNESQEDRKQSPKVSKINGSMKYGRHGTYSEKPITNLGKTQPSKMPMESRQLVENGLLGSERFWSDVLPLYLELK